MKSGWEKHFEDALIERFQVLKNRNHRYSVRSFAKLAKISATSMSLILSRSDKWSLTFDSAIRTLKTVKLDTEKINSFIIKSAPLCIDDGERLPAEDLFFTDPSYISILLAFGLKPVPSVERISKVLHLSPARIENIISDLLKMGHLTKTSESYVVPNSSKKIKTGDGPRNEILRQLHRSNIELMQQALQHNSGEKHDITSITLTGDATQLEAVKLEIRQFHQRIHAILNHSKKQNEVFKMVVGIMPLNFHGPHGEKSIE